MSRSWKVQLKADVTGLYSYQFGKLRGNYPIDLDLQSKIYDDHEATRVDDRWNGLYFGSIVDYHFFLVMSVIPYLDWPLFWDCYHQHAQLWSRNRGYGWIVGMAESIKWGKFADILLFLLAEQIQMVSLIVDKDDIAVFGDWNPLNSRGE